VSMGYITKHARFLDIGIASADITEAHMYGTEVARSEMTATGRSEDGGVKGEQQCSSGGSNRRKDAGTKRYLF
jgi:hypothetical protein